MEDMLRHFRFLSVGQVLSMSSFKRCQDFWGPLEKFVSNEAAEAVGVDTAARGQQNYMEGGKEPPYMIIFVSHRWETAGHPDPSRRQLQALQKLLWRTFGLLKLFCDNPDMARTTPYSGDSVLSPMGLSQSDQRIASLGVHGNVQAAVLAFRFATCDGVANLANDELATTFLAHCGVWFDFTCVPQAPRTEIEESEFRGALRSLQALLTCERTSVVALRQSGDDYENRAWCVAECMSGVQPIVLGGDQLQFPMVLRIDQVDEVLATDCISPGLQKVFDCWRSDDPETAQPIHETVIELVQAAAMLRPPRSDEKASSSDTGNLATRTDWLHIRFAMLERSLILHSCATSSLTNYRGGEVDLAAFLVRISRGKQLLCTNRADVVFACLLVLNTMRWKQFSDVRRARARMHDGVQPSVELLGGLQLPLDQVYAPLSTKEYAMFEEDDLWKIALGRLLDGQGLRVIFEPDPVDASKAVDIYGILNPRAFQFAEYDDRAKHEDTICDACGKSPVGPLWNCDDCPDYQLCDPCFRKSRGLHTLTHRMDCVRVPCSLPQSRYLID